MTAKSIWDLAKLFQADEALHQDFMIRKLGYDPNIPEEV